jgi:TctA family transporter
VVAELTGDAKELLKYVASSVAGMLIASLPGIATAIATTIAATLAVIVIRNGLTQFCAIGMQAIDAEGLAD